MFSALLKSLGRKVLFILSLAVLLPIPGTLYAETIKLRSGRTITAPVIEYADDHLKLNVSGVSVTYYKDEIESISTDNVSAEKKLKTNPDPAASLSPLIKKVSESVVIIESKKEKSVIEGTGFFISSDGLVATNLHVVFKASSIKVKTKSGQSFPAQFIVNYNDDLDICLLKINATDMPALPLGDSDLLKSGQTLFTIGHREGSFYQTSSGPFLRKRTIDGEVNLESKMITGHGNSGGPILNEQGQIVGITRAFNPANGENYGIPIDIAKNYLNYNNPLSVSDFNKQISPANELTFAGQALFLADKYGEALNNFKKALSLDPNYLKALIGCAKAYKSMFMDKEELAAWQDVQNRDPDNIQAFVRIGKLYLNQNNLDEAIKNLKKAVDLVPSTVEAYGDLGFAYGQKGMSVEAIQAYKKAIALNPLDADSHYNLAVAYFNKRDFTEAEKFALKAQKLGYAVPDSFSAKLEQSKKYGDLFELK